MREELKNLTDTAVAIRKLLEEQAALQRAAMIQPDNIFRFVYEDVEIALYLPNAAYDHIQRSILKSACFYENALLRSIRSRLPPSPVIVDAGANIGNHAVYFGKLCNASVVHAFEPQRYVSDILARNVEINRLANIVTYRAALGERAARASLDQFTAKNLGATSFLETDEGGYEVRTIDSLSCSRVDLIKIDVEGHQASVLRGAESTLREFRPLIVCELRSSHDAVEESIDILHRCNYRRDDQFGHNAIFVGN